MVPIWDEERVTGCWGVGGTAEPAVRLFLTTQPLPKLLHPKPPHSYPRGVSHRCRHCESMKDSNTSPGSKCKFFEGWDRDLGFLVMARVVLLSLPAPPTSAPSLPRPHPRRLPLSCASPVCPQGHVFHHLSPPLGDSDDCLPNSLTGSFTFCLGNRILIFRYGHRCAQGR